MNAKPFSQACENNKQPILHVLQSVFSNVTKVWEIGSGTGQHACYFAQHLPHLTWQPTDRRENLPGIQAWCEEAALDNLNAPLALDVTDLQWPSSSIEALFTANTLHIMSWQAVETSFMRLGENLSEGAPLCLYGPFNYNGTYTSVSNANFDQSLKQSNPKCGIRDFEAVIDLGLDNGIELIEDIAMPANNRLLVLQKINA